MGPAASANDTRAIISGGQDASGYSNGKVNTIQYVTIATTGNATDFGDLTEVKRLAVSTANKTRATINGGQGSGYVNTIEYVTIDTPGNATDFGDLLAANSYFSACSGN